MPLQRLAQTLADQLDQVAARTPVPDSAMVAAVVREMMLSLQGDLSTDDLRLYHEIKGLSDAIHKMRQDIAGLNPAALTSADIPNAADELEAVVQATEEATGKILDAAERVGQVAEALAGTPAADTLTDAVTMIFEASNFQDITGQRITKVVKTLQVIEHKVAAMLGVFGGSSVAAGGDPAIVPVTAGARISADDPQSLLNGPQLPGSAASQDDIDALFDSL
jgi:chemotaxis protein CheZ